MVWTTRIMQLGRAISRSAAMPRSELNLAFSRIALISKSNVRTVSSQQEKVLYQEELVRETLKKMINDRDIAMDEEAHREINHAELEQRFSHYQNVLREAELCIADLKEAKEEDREEEAECASSAVNKVFEAYLDFLEDLRDAKVEQLESYADARVEQAAKLKQLRANLAEVLKNEVDSV